MTGKKITRTNVMKIVSFDESKEGTLPTQRFGLVSNDERAIFPLEKGIGLLEAVHLASQLDLTDFPVEPINLGEVRLLAPVPNPQKIVCVGKNYADHAREMGGEPPELPVIFNKFPTALNHPNADIDLPAISDSVDFEAELVVVIGRAGKNISRNEAMDHVLGYCCGNDISARDWQKGKPGGQWLLGKSFDGFAPIGPWLVTAEQVNVNALDIELRLNGVTMQKSNTVELIFKVDFLISHVSQFFELRPGDLLFTGTPAGVGAGRTPPLFLKSGDTLEVEVSGLGILKNTVR